MTNPPAPMLTRRAVTAGLASTLFVLGRGAGAQQAVAANPEAQTWRAAPLRRPVRPDGSAAELWAFNGMVPGPVLRVRLGEEVRLKLANDTPKPLSLHWQGIRGPNPMDGVGGLTQDPVPPGGNFEYRFRPPDPGTFLIRPCVLGGSAEAAERGLTALLIVDEPASPPVDQDIAVLFDDWLLTDGGDLAPFGAGAAAGRLGNWLTVNGAATPSRIEVAPGSRVRLRLANGANARALRIRFEGIRPYVVAVDGQPTDTFEPLKASLPFAPGTRYDLLLDMPGEAGATGSVVGQLGTGATLVSLVTAGERAPARPGIGPLVPNPNLPPAIKLETALRRDVIVSGGDRTDAPPWLVNGKAGSAAMPALFSVKRGTPVVLAVTNRSSVPQPLHLHGHAFRLLHPYDDGWDPYFLDTTQVPEGRTMRLAFVADNPGKWLLASSVLERFDAGLWTWFEVT